MCAVDGWVQCAASCTTWFCIPLALAHWHSYLVFTYPVRDVWGVAVKAGGGTQMVVGQTFGHHIKMECTFRSALARGALRQVRCARNLQHVCVCVCVRCGCGCGCGAVLNTSTKRD